LAQWEGSVIRYDGVTTLAGGETTPRREKGVDDASWVDVNLTVSKIKKIHVIDSASTNG
jgi:hypothetical protein